MQIELRKVSHNARLSEETNAFWAEVWIDGVKAGSARNDGHGGCTFIEPHALRDRLAAYAKTLPAIVSDIVMKGDNDPFRYDPTAETLVDDALEQHLAAKRLTRILKTKLVVVREGKCYTVGPFKTPGFAQEPSVVARYVKPGDVLLNTMPVQDAVKALIAAHG